MLLHARFKNTFLKGCSDRATKGSEADQLDQPGFAVSGTYEYFEVGISDSERQMNLIVPKSNTGRASLHLQPNDSDNRVEVINVLTAKQIHKIRSQLSRRLIREGESIMSSSILKTDGVFWKQRLLMRKSLPTIALCSSSWNCFPKKRSRQSFAR